MRPALATRALAILALLTVLGACTRSGAATSEEVALGATVEQSRGHLQSALANARAGRWDLAATHAAHPAETQQTIDAALSRHDPTADGALRQGAKDVVAAAQARDLGRLEAAIAEQDARYERVPAAVMGAERAGALAYRASVLATLVESAGDEYGEAVVEGKVSDLVEYQDAYAFLRRGAEIWDGVKARIAETHQHEHDEVAEALEGLEVALPAFEPPAQPRAAAEVGTLAATVKNELSEAVGTSTAVAGSAAFDAADERLTAAITALDHGDGAGAAREVRAFVGAWGAIEGTVKARSIEAYKGVEDDTAVATSALAADPADTATARAAIVRIQGRLAPLASSPTSYGAFDAAVILLREGLEALLVLGALLAFLTKSGNADKRRWIWAGGASGIVVSVAVALLVNVAFSAGTAAGLNPEVLEGVTGIFAAVMLLYVSWWMHSKANIGGWQRYIQDRTSSAVARNSLFGLALIAFLAVFREGAETVLFYLGIAPSIALSDLLLGLGIGALGLAVIGVALLVFSVRIPLRPFFLIASLFIYYLAFKFIGSGIRALQVAGIVPVTNGAWPEVPFFAVYPTWETTSVQLLLLAAALAYLLYERTRARAETVSA